MTTEPEREGIDPLKDPNAEIEITCPNCQKDFDAGYIIRNEFKIALTAHHQELQKAREEEREKITNELDGLMEKLADIEHVRWAKWQNYLHSHLTWNNEIQAWVLQHEWKDRWQMQINKPYSMLSEKEKGSDREQVRPYLELIKRKVRYQSELDHLPDRPLNFERD